MTTNKLLNQVYMEKQLKVTGVRYFETRRGLGYECKTNINGLLIWNDGNGGGTFFRLRLSEYEQKRTRSVRGRVFRDGFRTPYRCL